MDKPKGRREGWEDRYRPDLELVFLKIRTTPLRRRKDARGQFADMACRQLPLRERREELEGRVFNNLDKWARRKGFFPTGVDTDAVHGCPALSRAGFEELWRRTGQIPEGSEIFLPPPIGDERERGHGITGIAAIVWAAWKADPAPLSIAVALALLFVIFPLAGLYGNWLRTIDPDLWWMFVGAGAAGDVGLGILFFLRLSGRRHHGPTP